MGRQMYFYYLEWPPVYNQNKAGYLQITTLQFHHLQITKYKIGYLQITKTEIWLFSKKPKIKKWLFLNNQMRDWLFIK